MSLQSIITYIDMLEPCLEAVIAAEKIEANKAHDHRLKAYKTTLTNFRKEVKEAHDLLPEGIEVEGFKISADWGHAHWAAYRQSRKFEVTTILQELNKQMNQLKK